ncbi:MAG: hypothetical protein IT454_18220 [Planctomycetes bacterium]|nr:hypothetical protein [Planctomycetota bacterium]
MHEFVMQGGRWTTLATLLLLWSSVALAPARAQKTEIEEFEKLDPYTKGERAALDKAGYVTLSPDRYGEKHTPAEMLQTLGTVSVIQIETAHFRIISTLETYKPTTDVREKAALEAEFDELKKKLPKAKLSSKIDPWLRAHLYAQRLEKLYEDFWRRFGLREDDFISLEAKAAEGMPMGVGPYLGQKEKFIVLLSNTRSALGRYLRTYVGQENEYSYRAHFPDCYFFGTNFEALEDNGRDLDIALYTQTAGAVVQNFLDAFRDSNQPVPEWLRYGLAHWYSRRIDARWNQWNAGGASDPENDENWRWPERIVGLVKNDAAVSWEQMTDWATYEDIKPRDHMLCWSRVDWLLDQRKGDMRAFLMALTHPVTPVTGPERTKAIRDQEWRAYSTVWKQTPAELDRVWRAWMLKQYPKRDE